MNAKVIKECAWVGKDYVEGKIKGVVLNFHGLNGGLKSGPSTEDIEWARNGGLVVYPYYGPWSWMNRQSRAMIDELVDAVYESYSLTDKAPLICTGGSMGGLSSLLYTRYARRPVSACYANCPVCDLAFHFNERPDLPPTIRHAFLGYPESLPTLLAEHSPLDQAGALPDIPYRIIHGTHDQAVSKKNHSDKLVPAMRKHKLTVDYIEVEGMGHCNPLPLKVLAGNIDFVAAALNKRRG